MALNPKTSQLSSLAEWSMQHIRDVFEASSDELSLRAIGGTFSRTIKATLNGTPLDFDGLCGLVSAMRRSATSGLDVEWSRADDAPDDPGNRNGLLVGEYRIRGIWKSNPGSGQLSEYERHKKVVVRIESQSPQAGVDSRLIVKLDIVASDIPKVNATPRKFIDTAHHRSAAGLSALLDLSQVWADAPSTIELGIIDMFLSHLRVEKAPKLTRIPRKWDLDADFAFLSIMGLGRMTQPFIENAEHRTRVLAVAKAWPGIFRWCSYIYEARVASESASESAEIRRIHLDGINMLFNVLTQYNRLVVPMVETPECLELATKLWFLEDIPRGVESIMLGRSPTAALSLLINIGTVLDKNYVFQRILSTAHEDSDLVAELLLRRISSDTRAFDAGETALDLAYQVDLAKRLGVITKVTITFVSLSRIIVDMENPPQTCIDMLTACVAFFSQCLEGEDYPSLTEAVRAGFIAGYLNCSPAFKHLSDENAKIAVDILRCILPPLPPKQKFNTPHHRKLIAQPLIQPAWRFFTVQLKKRQRLLGEAKMFKGVVKCDNVKCGKVDYNSEFRHCAACKVACYCSPECQRREWKASHKVQCPEIQAERAGHRQKGRPKDDLNFTHAIASSDADIKFAFFHDLAARKFPNTLRSQLMLCIDYTKVPEEYSIKAMDEPGASGHPDVSFSPELTADLEQVFRQFVRKMQADPDATLIQSIVASGATVEILFTPMGRKHFWEDTNTYSSGSDGSSDDTDSIDSD
ncbi:hypothetical protein MVEN_02113800 [Mycena venus]|uniref:MYND-type domain-containing protein n=1 Tax=Mycena venus TaxID=2733690 RepID=A0A8H6XA80_9AGAR|nr:hypothetical protein MVEN_02113800 [Mycena venus]